MMDKKDKIKDKDKFKDGKSKKERDKKAKEIRKEIDKERDKERDREKEREKLERKEEKLQEKHDKSDKHDKGDKDSGSSIFSKMGSKMVQTISSISTPLTSSSTTTTASDKPPGNNVENHKKVLDFWQQNVATPAPTSATPTTVSSSTISVSQGVVGNNSSTSSVGHSSSPSGHAGASFATNGHSATTSVSPVKHATPSPSNSSPPSHSNNNSKQHAKDDNNTSTTSSNISSTPSSTSSSTSASAQATSAAAASIPTSDDSKKVVQQLVQYTTAYADSIKAMLDIFYQPLKKNEQVITHDELRRVFLEVDSIHSIASSLVDDLQKCLHSSSSLHSNLLSILTQYMVHMKKYKQYALLYNYSIAALCSLSFNNTRFDHFVKNAEQKMQSEHGFKLAPIVDLPNSGVMKPVLLSEIFGVNYEVATTLKAGLSNLRRTGLNASNPSRHTTDYAYYSLPSLLVLPVHWMARFNGSIKQLADTLSSSSQQGKASTTSPELARSYMKLYDQFGTIIKEVVLDSNNINKVISISNSIKSTTIGLFNSADFVKGRRFLKEGSLTEQYNNQRTTYHTFLFSDIILFTEKVDDVPPHSNINLIAYEGCLHLLKKMEKVSNIQVDDSELGFEYRKGFQIKNREVSMLYMAASEKDKGEWMQKFTQATKKEATSALTQGQQQQQQEDSDEDDGAKDIQTIMRSILSGQRSKFELSKSLLKTGDKAQVFAQLSSTSFITHLSFAPNTMSEKLINLLVGFLVASRSITNLDLSQNSLTPSMTVAIGDALRFNQSLSQLDLNECQINNAGVASLVDGIISHPSLSIVSLNGNAITSVTHLARLVRHSHTLQTLSLEDKALSMAAVTELLDVWLASHTTQLSCLIFAAMPGDYEERAKVKAAQITARQDSRKRRELIQKAAPAAHPKTLLDLGHLNVPEITLSYINKVLNAHLDNKRLSDITELYLDSNCITTVPTTLFKELGRLHVLDLSSNQLTALPNEIGELRELRRLNVAHNDLSVLPTGIQQLAKLEHLDISFNVIESIPDDTFTLLTGLRTLMMQRNFFSRLPSAMFASLKSLQAGSFSINGAPCFHPVKQKIIEAWATRVVRLDLSDSNISCLPLEIGNIASLTDLNISQNRIKSLPPQISRLASLSVLDISYNQLTELPWQMSRLRLKSMCVAGNPFATEAKYDDVLVEDQLIALFSRLRGQIIRDTPCMRMKLMLVGQENVGKTSIAKCLKKDVAPVAVTQILRKGLGLGLSSKKKQASSDADSQFGINPLNTTMNLSTDGIDMEVWRPSASSQDDASSPPVTFNLWDFAGQEVYYSTHQFFISSRSLFVVVFNMVTFLQQQDDARVSYWLQCIEAWGGDAQVVLVGTHLDELTSGQEERIQAEIDSKFCAAFPSIKGFLAVSCKTSKNINKLQALLVKVGRAEKKLGQSHPQSFTQLESLIVNEREMNNPPIITKHEFLAMAEQCGITADQVPKASHFLKELGIIVYFDDDKSGLDAFVFIDPPWLTRLLATLITSKPNFVQAGVLEQSNLHQIWKAPDFPHHLHHVLLAILQRFEIVHPLPDPKFINTTPIPSKSSAQRVGGPITTGASTGGISKLRSTFSSPSPVSASAPVTPSPSPSGSKASLSSFNRSPTSSFKGIPSSSTGGAIGLPASSPSHQTTLIAKVGAKHLVPVLLSEERPSALERTMDELKRESTVLERVYQFEFFPVGMFSKLMIRIMHFTTVKEFWKHGLLVEREQATSLIEAHANQVSIRAWGKSAATILRFIMETAEVLLDGWYKLSYQLLVVCSCSNCRSVNGMAAGLPSRAHGSSNNSSSESLGELIQPQLQQQLTHQLSQTNLNSSREGLSTSPLSTSFDSEADGEDIEADSISPGGTLKPNKRYKKNGTPKFLSLYNKNKMSKHTKSFVGGGSPSMSSAAANRPNDLRTMYPYDDCQRAIIGKRTEVLCRSPITGEEKMVKLETLVPELLLTDLGANFTIQYKELEIIEKIGEGGFGTVFKGRLRGQLVAIKQLVLEGGENVENVFREFTREVWLSNTLNQKSIVTLKACCLDPCCLVMEYIPNGNLHDFLRKQPQAVWSIRIKIALNIAGAIQYLHEFTPKICHRDLKSPNILMLGDLSDRADVVCKVSDFGESRAVVTSALGRDKLSNPIWLAPEIMRGQEYTEKADVYSFGIILWEILTGMLPFDEYPVARSQFISQLEDAICEGMRPTIPAAAPAAFASLIQDCWHKEPQSRPTFAQISQRLMAIKEQNLKYVVPIPSSSTPAASSPFAAAPTPAAAAAPSNPAPRPIMQRPSSPAPGQQAPISVAPRPMMQRPASPAPGAQSPISVAPRPMMQRPASPAPGATAPLSAVPQSIRKPIERSSSSPVIVNSPMAPSGVSGLAAGSVATLPPMTPTTGSTAKPPMTPPSKPLPAKPPLKPALSFTKPLPLIRPDTSTSSAPSPSSVTPPKTPVTLSPVSGSSSQASSPSGGSPSMPPTVPIKPPHLKSPSILKLSAPSDNTVSSTSSASSVTPISNQTTGTLPPRPSLLPPKPLPSTLKSMPVSSSTSSSSSTTPNFLRPTGHK
ncbi:hypothetical protein SAMD00019534_110050 [Acytostelium subglobosum LB1]|uniref:hypothetical protein n=1 Tax=Acytostelium subglobosum LB1 TaxID=1410327 RepID=UPI000644CA71|nr:hypothetical protein SAMD00019534_110050 [Acytostelium subglobosum LB1]GAM27829.1 hypothetical protein SAMD00019534_110050 [Acytostelium subglobosum LB1]|eukprot:XP_012749112.1 hypothetical protein SAMD00019534_110050 [Acytostelium subglobosum LB1]